MSTVFLWAFAVVGCGLLFLAGFVAGWVLRNAIEDAPVTDDDDVPRLACIHVTGFAGGVQPNITVDFELLDRTAASIGYELRPLPNVSMH